MSVAEKIIPEIIQPKKMGLLVENPVYKPFRYPWCYDAWLTQQRIHWLPEEVPLGDDVRDWTKNITAAEKNLLTHIFRFFTQADVEQLLLETLHNCIQAYGSSNDDDSFCIYGNSTYCCLLSFVRYNWNARN